MIEFIKSHWRQAVFVLVVGIAWLFLPLDESYNIIYALGGFVIVWQSISMFDRYWSLKAKTQVSLSKLMANLDDSNKALIYCSIILGGFCFLGSVFAPVS